MSRKSLLLTLAILVLLVLASLFLFPSFRSFLSSRVLPIPPITETMVGGRLAATPLPGPHTLTYEARTSSGVTLTDSVTFTQPTTAAVCNNGVVETGEACDVPSPAAPPGPTNTGIAKDYCSNRCQVELDVTEYGATKDTNDENGTRANSDTPGIEQAVNTANSGSVKTPPGGPVKTVWFPAGLYYITQIHTWPGITLVGDGPTSIIKRLANRSSWERMLSTGLLNNDLGDTPTRYSVPGFATDSSLLTIKNLALDGNGTNQLHPIGQEGPTISTEHQEIILMDASGPLPVGETTRGKLKALVEDVSFTESGAASLVVYENTDVVMRNITLHNNFKGITIVGGNSKLLAEGFDVRNDIGWPPPGESFGEPTDGGVDIELTSSPWFTDVTLNNWTMEGMGIGAGLEGGSIFTVNNLQLSYPFFDIVGQDGTATISNSTITMGKGILYRPKNITFTDTTFIATENGFATEGNRVLRAMTIDWNAIPNQSVRCIRCTFDADNTVETGTRTTGDTVRAIVTTASDRLPPTDLLYLENGSISNKFDEGLYVDQGASTHSGTKWHIKGMNILATLGLFVQATSSSFYNITLENVTPLPLSICRDTDSSSLGVVCRATDLPPNQVITVLP